MTDPAPTRGGRRRFAISFLVVAALLAGADLWTKAVALEHVPLESGSSIDLIEGWFRVRTALNTGIPWGIQFGGPRILAVVSAVATLVILWIFYRVSKSSNPLFCFGLALILGGALGNLYDRALLPGVRDWIEFVPALPLIGHWPIFNLADAGICLGATLVFLVVSFTPHPEAEQKVTS